ncbi:MAG TPA: hypothetical protein K8V94_00995, partial [Corynebacterium amycolatum]|nr:hypothetical protein [Corynebacterium amycolatum]
PLPEAGLRFTRSVLLRSKRLLAKRKPSKWPEKWHESVINSHSFTFAARDFGVVTGEAVKSVSGMASCE